MAKIRVHELAKEMGIPSKQMVDTLLELGLDVKNHMSTMEESQALWVRKRLGSKTETAAEKVPIKPASGLSPRSDKPTAREEHLVNGARKDLSPDNRNNNQPIKKQADIRPQNDIKPGRPGINDRDRKPQTNRSGSEPGQGGLRQGRQESTGRVNAPNNRPIQGTSSQVNRQNAPRPGQAPASGDNRPRPTSGQDNRQNAPRPGQAPASGNNRPRPTSGQDNRQTTRQTPGSRPPAGAAPGRPERRPGAPIQSPGRKPIQNDAKKGFDNKVGQGTQRSAGTPGQKKPGIVNTQGKPGKKTAPSRPQFTRDYSRPQRKGKHKKKKEEVILQTPEIIQVGDSIQVRELADKLAKGSAEIVKKLMELGIMATINQGIDFETVEILASLYDVTVEREISEEEQILEEIIDSEESLVPRSPIVTVMGHVDHGKTSLLDKVRKADVVSGEAGGITQHIGAYQVTVKGNRITFIDTPGHEAFTAMRARGANLTDIVILVVAADDGVMPQTIEAINHIKAAGVPFIVALNKMDKADVNPDKVMQQLTEYNIVPEEWGGDTMFIPVSAKTGMGIDTLLEMVLLVAEMNDLKANPDRQAEGVVIEGELDKGKGAVATLLVQKGTLKIGDCIVCGFTWCKVRAMTDYRGRRVDLAYPSMPVEITGWSDVPEVGEKVLVTDEKIAKEITGLRLTEKKLEDQKQSSKISLDDFFKQMQNSGMKELNLIIKGDVQGSIEALAQSLLRLSTSEVKVNVIHSAVGAITETDVMLASASNAIIIGFNVRPDVKARKYGEDEKIDIRMYRVIYEAIDDVKKAMEGLLDPEYREKYLGRAEVRQTFKVPNIGTIAGSYIIDGKLQRNANIRVLRDSVIIYDGKLASLKRFKDDAKEVVEGYECGIGIKDFNDLKEGDIIEAYTMEEIAREL
jgi:translation initiation factor IF-2